MILVEETVVEVLVVCIFCDELVEHADDLWCPDCDDDATGSEGSRAPRQGNRSEATG